MATGYWCPVLHAHLPFVRHPEHPEFLEEDWFFEALSETYVPLVRVLDGLERDGVEYRLTLTLTPTLVAMMADVADYSEWKTHRRATAIVFSGIVFALKAGLGFGGAITGYVLAYYGYVPNAEQTSAALDAIRYTMSVLPAVGFAACAACLLLYGIDKSAEIRITDDLRERRHAQATA